MSIDNLSLLLSFYRYPSIVVVGVFKFKGLESCTKSIHWRFTVIMEFGDDALSTHGNGPCNNK